MYNMYCTIEISIDGRTHVTRNSIRIERFVSLFSFVSVLNEIQMVSRSGLRSTPDASEGIPRRVSALDSIFRTQKLADDLMMNGERECMMAMRLPNLILICSIMRDLHSETRT